MLFRSSGMDSSGPALAPRAWRERLAQVSLSVFLLKSPLRKKLMLNPAGKGSVVEIEILVEDDKLFQMPS